ncbi:hypothetical protein QVD17_27527 [Tagetes erecta]|uniref:Uncharacterized protein n=1 Tax=Tagetes erecta TaxID=13708 RepID=A0AAD8NRP9_TARER|nr:hypothetical protein QVD17_27527 [Tagetes erecta]
MDHHQIISHNNNLDDDDDQDSETISLTNFPISNDHNTTPPSSSSPTGDFFEFNSDDYNTMSHAEDIIFCGKLIPINHRNNPPEQTQAHHKHPIGRSRSESMAKHKPSTSTPLVRTSRSLDYKKMKRNSSISSERAPEMIKKSSSSSSRWYVFLFGLVKVPPSEMDIKEIKNRQVRRSVSTETFRVAPVAAGSVDHRKCSWKVLGFLSCKSASGADVTTPVGYVSKV